MESIIFTCILLFIVVFIVVIGIIKSNSIVDEDSTDTMSESSQSY